jgi:hypothetical protein
MGSERDKSYATCWKKGWAEFWMGAAALGYAGPQALKDMFGEGHYATVKAHADRWAAFVEWCRSDSVQVSMTPARSTGKRYSTMPSTCANRSSKAA